MMVLHVLEALSGGTARHVRDVVSNVPDFRHVVATPRGRRGWIQAEEPARRISEAGAEVRYLAMRRHPAHPVNLVAVGAVRAMIRTLQPDVLHGHSSIGGAIARVASAGTGIPCVYTPNAVSPHPAALRLERLLSRRTARVIAVSESEGRLFKDLGVVPANRLVVIPNGIEIEPPPAPDRSLRTLASVPMDAALVGWIGRLVPQKAPETFVRVCAEVARTTPGAHFVMIGSGPLEGAVRAAVHRHALEAQFHLVPWLAGAAAHIPNVDVTVSTAVFEGGPYVPLESMRAAVPMVLTAVTGNVDLVEEGISGFLAPPGDAPALGSMVARLLADADLRASVGRAARSRFLEQFDARLMGRRLGRLYGEVAAS